MVEFLFDDGADGVDPTKHPYFQCKIDLYKCFKDGQKGKLECLRDYRSCMAVLLPTIPTLPPFVIACKDNLKSCMTSASGFKAKALCFKQLAICLKNKGPSSDVAMDVSYDGEPDRHPYVQCKIDLYDCVQDGTPKLECLNKYKSCMAAMLPTIPPHVIACNAEFKQCLKDSWLLGKALCFTELGKCLVRPIPIPAFLQCKIDLVNCFKDGQKDKLECAKDYTGCLSALIPTISPPVKQCFATFEQCSYKAGGIFDLYRCIKAVGICVNNGGPTTQLPL
ncbi:hypothetical protein OS493_013871 [Desmophyllum pertusum]|uniref:Uncharacterized protein n=1 Tax=Desmophyllum pertusum TaxID=174260 RepID=A0A9W9ZQA7_9CNID|nr:hypothetical protein OS493_013871 [Desmophyllum pertusum]